MAALEYTSPKTGTTYRAKMEHLACLEDLANASCNVEFFPLASDPDLQFQMQSRMTETVTKDDLTPEEKQALLAVAAVYLQKAVEHAEEALTEGE